MKTNELLILKTWLNVEGIVLGWGGGRETIPKDFMLYDSIYKHS